MRSELSPGGDCHKAVNGVPQWERQKFVPAGTCINRFCENLFQYTSGEGPVSDCDMSPSPSVNEERKRHQARGGLE